MDLSHVGAKDFLDVFFVITRKTYTYHQSTINSQRMRARLCI